MVWLVVHILAVGAWFGCVATEVAFERTMGSSEADRLRISTLHDLVDRYVEAPAFIIAALSGAVLSFNTIWTAGLVAKIGVGLVAVVANVWCMKLVFDRARAAKEGRFEDWVAIDHAQHKWGGVVALGLVVTIAIGILRVA